MSIQDHLLIEASAAVSDHAARRIEVHASEGNLPIAFNFRAAEAGGAGFLTDETGTPKERALLWSFNPQACPFAATSVLVCES